MHPPPIKPLSARPWPSLALPLFLALLLFGGRGAPAAETLVYGQGLLWKVEREGVPPSHLFGTIHVTDAEVLALPPAVGRAFDSSDSLTSEVILSPENLLRLQQLMLLSDGRKLERIVGKDLFQRTATAAAGYGIPPQVLQRLKPWAAMTFFVVPDAEMRRKLAAEKVLDERLQEEARRRGMAIHALEEVEEQMGWFDNLGEAEQVAMLANVIDFTDQIPAMFEALRRAYLDRDTARILVLLLDQQAGSDAALIEAFTEQMLHGRNDRMVERMVPRLAEGASFIAVGALHLPGERGILRQLEARGYRVTRLY